MGFFGDITRTLTGGSKGGSSSSSKSGFQLLPSEIQGTFKDYATNISDILNSGNLTDMYTPLEQTSYETQALDTVGGGLAPTQESLTADINMQMNPYMGSVIDTVNRQAAGDYSITKQALNEAGQLGSNRQLLGANDIEQTRLNTIGNLMSDQYNTALSNSLNEISGLRQQDVLNQFTAGEFLRNLQADTQQAPINALTAIGSAIGVLPQSGGSTSTSESQNTSSKGLGELLGGFAKG